MLYTILNIKYISEGRVKNSEVYNSTPVLFNLTDSLLLKNIDKPITFSIIIKSENQFDVWDSDNNILHENVPFDVKFDFLKENKQNSFVLKDIFITKTTNFSSENVGKKIIISWYLLKKII